MFDTWLVETENAFQSRLLEQYFSPVVIILQNFVSQLFIRFGSSIAILEAFRKIVFAERLSRPS